MLGYHLINVLWHGIATVLVFANVRKLNIPGALLAAAIFALHPVMVESVAWVTEQKNTLSTVFYLGAMYAYLSFDQRRKRLHYATAFGLFVLGLLTKTVTATLPAALLVIFWWQRGRLSWRRDVLPLVPFFLLGAVAGLGTALVERKLIGAEGADFELSIVSARPDRRPSHLLLLEQVILAREPDIHLSALADRSRRSVAMDLSCGRARHYDRALADPQPHQSAARPAGSFSVARCSQCLGLECVPICVFIRGRPFSVSCEFGNHRSRRGRRNRCTGQTFTTGPPTGVCRRLHTPLRTRRNNRGYARNYRNPFVLYQTTLEKNPECWLAEMNLGTLLASSGQPEQAIRRFRRAIDLKSDYADLHANLGILLCTKGELAEGLAELQGAVRLARPDEYNALDLANALRDERLFRGGHQAVRDSRGPAAKLARRDTATPSRYRARPRRERRGRAQACDRDRRQLPASL